MTSNQSSLRDYITGSMNERDRSTLVCGLAGWFNVAFSDEFWAHLKNHALVPAALRTADREKLFQHIINSMTQRERSDLLFGLLFDPLIVEMPCGLADRIWKAVEQLTIVERTAEWARRYPTVAFPPEGCA